MNQANPHGTQDIFEVTKLSDHEIGHLEFVLNSPAYERVFRPYLERARAGYLHRLLDPSGQRKDQYPDDFLRGGIAALDGFLAFFQKLVDETQIARIAAAQSATAEDEYHRRVAAGHIRGAGQHVADEY